LPRHLRRRVLIRADSGGGTQGFLTWLAKPRRRLELTEDLRGAGARIRQTRKKAALAVRAARTSLTGLFGVGPVIAAAVIGDVRTVSRFPDRDHFAAYNGTAPIEVSSGGRQDWRLCRRGNRRP